MLEREPLRNAAGNVKLAAMQRAVVCAAQDHELVRVVGSSLGAQVQMMNVDEPSVCAARHHAAALVAPHDEPPSCGRNTLLGANLLCAPVDAH